jgi:ABC-type antimicrobial peptide transport system permease subunit
MLAALGLYGVMAYLVGRRTREIGIRLALGARPGGILRMILRRAALVAGAGAVVGLALAAVTAGLVGSVLYGPGAADTTAWTWAIGVLAVAATSASVIPAVRAMRVDPIKQLRTDT